MAAHRRFLGIDVGTQSTKALVLDADSGEVAGRGAVAYGLIEGLPSGHMEQHPQTWIDAIRGAAKQAMAGLDPSTVLGVGVSGQQHGSVVLDEQLRVVRGNGEPIPNFYAAGEVLGSGATLGNAFAPGMMLTPALALGRWLGMTLPIS